MVRSNFVVAVVGLALAGCGPSTNAGQGAAASSALSPSADTSSALSLRKGTLSWTCKGSDGHVALQLTHKDTVITTETVDAYPVIVNGAQQADSAIGQNVFDVVAGKITFIDSQEMQLKLSLQDYSDIMSWTFILQADPNASPDFTTHYAGVELSTYQSSDGDDLFHPTSDLVTCDVTKS
jgi:hypothetical protein